MTPDLTDRHVFRANRLALKLTQAGLAAELCMEKRQIGRYENGAAEIPEYRAKLFAMLIERNCR